MLVVLAALEKQMPYLVRQHMRWRTTGFTFTKPGFRVERLYSTWEHEGSQYRIRLHKFHPYETEAMIHHHEWPMAARILEGKYEMQLGWSDSQERPPAHATLILPSGSTYEMTHIDMWHSVRPLEVTWTTMVYKLDAWPQKRVCPIKSNQIEEDAIAYKSIEAPEFYDFLNKFKGFYPLAPVA